MNPVGYLETNVLFCGDNLEHLSAFPAECVDLIYLDPPFFSNRNYEVIWGDEAEIRSFEDRWEGGINHYVEWMRHRMIEMHRVLKPTGTIYLHCDFHAGHYLKVMMDEIFGTRQFLNEIVWHYKTSSGAPAKWLHRNHDTIFRYAARSPDDVTWHHPKEPWPESTLKKWQKDEEGRIYRLQAKYGKRYYIDPEGKLMDDVWEITLSSRTRERLGYPTQKPEALLERIIASSSNDGDIVLDPFCGCGTTVAVAERLKRQWIGIDISPTAVNLMKRRLLKATGGAVEMRMEGLPVTEVDLRTLKPFEFQNWVIQRVNGSHSPTKSGDMGIDGFAFMTHEPIQVKQSQVGRNVVDNFQTAMERVKAERGYIIGFGFSRGAREEVARVRRTKGLEIKLVKVASLVGDPQLVEQRPTPDLFEALDPEDRPDTFLDLPLPEARSKAARPSAEDLVKSDLEAQARESR